MRMRTTTHNFAQHLENSLECVEKDKRILPEDRQEILAFDRYITAEGLGFARRLKYSGMLRQLLQDSAKPSRDWSRADVEACINRTESMGYSSWTKHDFRVTLRRYFRWLRGTEETPPEVRFLKVTAGISNQKLPEEMLTEEEIGRMITACKDPRDRAFLACLYETGCRPDELGSLRLKHVQPDNRGFVLVVNGKMGMRRTRVAMLAHHLSAWIDAHPRRDDPEAVLWTGRNDVDCRVPLFCNALNNIVKLAAKRAGIRKRVYPYLFRHSRATFLASKLTEAQMNLVFGWKQGSDMPRTYVHMSGRDIDEALLQIAGVAKEDIKPKESILKPKSCVRCDLTNPGTSKYCMRCTAPLDSAEIIKAEDDASAAGKLIAELLEGDETFQEIVKERIRLKLANEQLRAHGQTSAAPPA